VLSKATLLKNESQERKVFEIAKSLGGTPAAIDHITGHLCSKVRVFLTEIAEGVSNYRSMHNLTEQVEHQYHGRFLIELIQNAHDALGEHPGSGRIHIRFERDDSVHGSLLVANDGEPFSRSNFEKISALGQSDKDPQKSIGNKGIGFRSVLELTDRPEIYSRRTAGSLSFDGYCFAFRPSTVGSLVEPMTELAFGEGIPVWEMSGAPLVQNWSSEMLAQYRSRVATMGREWLAQEVRYLSPYLLPVAIGDREDVPLQVFEQSGFATVVRLPLKSALVAQKVREKMASLDPSTCLFLRNLRELTIHQGAAEERTFHRTVTEDSSGGKHVTLAGPREVRRDYFLWRTSVRIADAPEKVRVAVKALPGRWPEMQDAEVSIAIRGGGEHDAGRFSIYLPTHELTGSAVHVNAPFYGDMSRTSIEFENAYNRHLVDVAVDLALSAALVQTAVHTSDAGRAVLDLLCPLAGDETGEAWSQHMMQAISRARLVGSAVPLVLTESGWATVRNAYQLPDLSACRVFTEDLVRRFTPVELLHRDLSQRRAKQFELLKEQFCGAGSGRMSKRVLATLAASVAEVIRREGGNWNAFWRDVVVLLPNGQQELSRTKVLLGEDGELHQVEGGTKMFFLPRQGTPDAGDVDTDSLTSEVPGTLQSSVAFLSDQIELYDSRGNSQNVVREYLGKQGLVTPFRVETIFTDILRRLTPQLPVPHESDDAQRCRDIFSWGMRLMRNIVARGRGAPETFKLMRDLPAPCRGGWFKLKDSAFGSGWSNPAGDALERYLGALSSSAGQAAYARILLSVNGSVDSDLGAAADKALLLDGGASDFLTLHEVSPSDWESSFSGSNVLSLPSGPPPGFSSGLWSETVGSNRHVPLPYQGAFRYRVESMRSFAGLEEYESLADNQKEDLSTLLFWSLPKWATVNWEVGTASKIGGSSGKARFESPLSLFMRTCPWMAVQDDSRTWNRPGDRWLVPADTLASRARHYAHLRALPAAAAAQIATRMGLVEQLRSLGMKVFNGRDDTPSTVLLEALTASIGTEAVADANVLLGQLREAWEQLRPDSSSVPLRFLPVRSRDRGLQRVQPTALAPIVLPDQAALSGTLEDLGIPVLAMLPRAAQRLREWFQGNYETTVQFASAMSVRPTVDGVPWNGGGSTPLSNSVLSWIATPLLVLVSQGLSVHASAFRKRYETLASANVAWVEGLELSVVRPDGQSLSKRVMSMWDAQSQTLLLDNSCRTQLADLSPALAQALEREDLQLSIRFVLSAIGKLPETPPDVLELLKPLGSVGEEEIHHIVEHLRGDVGHVVRYARLLARASGSQDVTDIEAAASEEELLAALQMRGFDPPKCSELFQLARETNDMFEFAGTLAERWPTFPTLSSWNEALRSFELSEIENKAWRSQFDAIVEELTWVAKRVARHVLSVGKADVGYTALCSTYATVGQGCALAQADWRVKFVDVAAALGTLFGRWLDDSELQEMLALSQDADEFAWVLEEVGVDLKVDPDEVGRSNAARVQNATKQLDRIRLAWLLRGSPGAPEWESCVDHVRHDLGKELGSSAFVATWSAEQVFTMLKGSFAAIFPDGGDFSGALESALSLDDLRSKLGVSEQELEESEARLRSAREAAAQRQNVVQVCGKEFDASEGNLRNLWDLLTSELPDSLLSSAPSLNLDETAPLDEPPAKRPVTRVNVPTSTQRRRQPTSVDQAVGLPGRCMFSACFDCAMEKRPCRHQLGFRGIASMSTKPMPWMMGLAATSSLPLKAASIG
jgi:Histidine kinase-, DNA gyrase B-, and HSP90-like ATPase